MKNSICGLFPYNSMPANDITRSGIITLALLTSSWWIHCNVGVTQVACATVNDTIRWGGCVTVSPAPLPLRGRETAFTVLLVSVGDCDGGETLLSYTTPSTRTLHSVTHTHLLSGVWNGNKWMWDIIESLLGLISCIFCICWSNALWLS